MACTTKTRTKIEDVRVVLKPNLLLRTLPAGITLGKMNALHTRACCPCVSYCWFIWTRYISFESPRYIRDLLHIEHVAFRIGRPQIPGESYGSGIQGSQDKPSKILIAPVTKALPDPLKRINSIAHVCALSRADFVHISDLEFRNRPFHLGFGEGFQLGVPTYLIFRRKRILRALRQSE